MIKKVPNFYTHLLAGLLLFTVPAGAQQRSLPGIKLRHQTIYPTANAQQWLDQHRPGSSTAKETEQAILVFTSLPSEKQKVLLEESGIYLRDYLSDNAFIAHINLKRSIDPAAVLLYAIMPMQPSWKITVFESAPGGQSLVDVLVSCYSNISASDLEQQIKPLGGKMRFSSLAAQHAFEVSIPADKITALAAYLGVKTISPVAKDEPLNFESTCVTKTNIAQLPQAFGGYGLLGDSISIGVGDNSAAVNHVDLRDRIINYNPVPYTNHGQHINGIVGGAGTMNTKTQGFAPHATLIDHLYNLVWARTGTMRADHNMTVTNNSYANVQGNCSFDGIYDAYSQTLDSICLQYPDVLQVFAAGNDGSINCPPYPAGFSTVTGSYQPAKNVLVVAQTDKRFNWGINSSRGPVRDGRLKPEITAVGTEVYSTRGGDLYLSSGGTSMASPQVAGAAGLVQQRYKQLHSNVTPASEIVKILLMNGATDIGNPGPDFTFGFGEMNLKRTLAMLDANRFNRNSVSNNGQQTFTINVPANTAQVKAMLYWHEGAASVLASKQLINDLDIEIKDPANNTTLPLVLDATPANVNNNAVNGVDRLNNVEQIVINNPAAGTYTITVKGTSIAVASQPYVIAWDFIPVGIELTYPTAGATVQSEDSLRIFWDASPDTRTFTVEFTQDNGANWTILNNSVPATQRHYTWYVTNIASQRCRIRVTRNGSSEVATSPLFVTNIRPEIRLNAVQCPGYMNINWMPIPNATAYRVWKKKGPYLQFHAQVTDTTYSLGGLSLDSTYYMMVQPLVNGQVGFRSLGISRRPNTGSCAGSFSNGDLMLEKIEAPVSGRQFTSTQLSATAPIVVRVRNLDDVATTNYRISYSFNNGAWQMLTGSTIPANGSLLVTIPANLNLSIPGSYSLKVAVTNLAMTDNVNNNDSLNVVIRHLSNSPVNFNTGVTEDFETSASFTAIRDSVGIGNNERWDYVNSSDTGRLRTFVNSDITISGNRSASFDVFQYVSIPNTNWLTGTFNAANFSTASSEVRLDFDYKMHGDSHFPNSNKVWVRGADNQPWREVFAYDLSSIAGTIQQARGVSLSDALIAGGQNFSTSTQVRFGQEDTTVIAMNNYGTGVTIDNIKMFTVQNDVAMDSLLLPVTVSCNLSNTPVVVRVYNGVSQALSGIRVSYQLDNGAIVTETIPSLAGKTSIIYTFTQNLNISTLGGHTLKTWVSATGDTYSANDTLIHSIRNQPLISSFPYLENFESSDGHWYAAGRNSTWGYGTPASINVSKAASGTKAWKTNLGGNYNDNELSYLYSPCFNVSGLANPMLSFSAVMDIENCGNIICDAAWVEYTTNNGLTWTRLGARGQGYMWYTDTANIWNQQGNYRWHVTSVPLPVTNLDLRLRFVLSSDPGASGEGLAIDDIHVFNRDRIIYNELSVGPLTQTVNGTQFVDFTSNNKLVAQIKPDGQNLGATDVKVYVHPAADTASTQYYLPRSFVINSAQEPVDSVTARLYVLDSEVDSMVHARVCNACSKPDDVYRLGMSKYDDSVKANENGVLSDNVWGTWSFYRKDRIKWVPYDNGYYAEVRLPSFSELWFNDGGPSGNLSLPNYSVGRNSLVSVYPNPNIDGVINIVWSTGMLNSIDVLLTDVMGKTVYQSTLKSYNGKNSAVINVGKIATGIYFLRCSIGNTSQVSKINFK